MTTTMAGVSTAAMLGGMNIAFAGPLEDGQSSMLLRMVQDIYPHPDRLQLAHYQAIADTIINGLEGDADKTSALTDGLTMSNDQSQALYGKDYAELEDADVREGVLRHVQNEGFFQGIRWTAYFGIDLPPGRPSFITRVLWFDSRWFRVGQARRAWSLQIAQSPGALRRVFGFPARNAA